MNPAAKGSKGPGWGSTPSFTRARVLVWMAAMVTALPTSACGQVSDGSARADTRTDPPIAAIESITEATVTEHLTVLASDELRGRDTPSEGLDRAAEYLAEAYERSGLRPGGDAGTFLQRYPFGLMGPDPDRGSVTLVGPVGEVPVRLGSDAFVDGGSDTPLDAPLVHVRMPDGDAPDPGSLEGRVAVFRLQGDWGQTLWLRSVEQTAFAREAGAVGSVHVLDPGFSASAVQQLGQTLLDPLWQLGGDTLFPRLFVRERAFADALGEPLPWAANAPAASPVLEPIEGASLRAELPMRVETEGRPPNVLAELPGRDPELRDEWIVLTAHLDHVGVGQPVAGDSIYNGADDNGSGTSALAEVARALAALPESERPRRSILVAHVSGEEKGLMGSRWWVTHPTVPIDRVVANVNVDMIGGRTHPDTIAVIGKDYSTLGPLIEAVSGAHPELELSTPPDLWPQENLFFRSDQLNFMTEEIPAVFLFAGFHECYHRPCDEIGFVDADKVARVARLIAYTLLEIANEDAPPGWTEEGLAEVRRMVTGGP